MLTATLPYATNHCVFHEDMLKCAAFVSLSEDYLHLSRSLELPPPASWCSNDWGRYFYILSKTSQVPQQCSTMLNLVTQKQGIHLLISLSTTILSAGTRPQPGVTQLPTMARLQVLITELLIRNQKVNSPPEKGEVRCQRVRAKE